jgi:hypothetical protein
MMRIGRRAPTLGALLWLCGAHAATPPTPEQLERVVFESLMISPDLEKSRLGARMMAEQFSKDDAWCDYVAERLLKQPDPPDDIGEDAVAWWVKTLRDDCSSRYRRALTLARPRFTREKIVRHLNEAFERPFDKSVAQYAEGGVDLLAFQIDVEQRMTEMQRTTSRNGAYATRVERRAVLGDVLAAAGIPRDLSSLTLRYSRWGHGTVLAAHYDGYAMLIFGRDGPRNQWLLADTYPELFPVSANYQGSRFDMAQFLACMRGLPFRDYIKIYGRTVRGDPEMIPVLAYRLRASAFPADDFELDALLIALKYIYASRHPDSVNLLRMVAAAPGDVIPRTANVYAGKLELRAARAQATAAQ